MNVVLLSTRKLAADAFDTILEDLGDPNLTLDVIAWLPPAAIPSNISTFTHIGPGHLPATPAEVPADAADQAAPPPATPAEKKTDRVQGSSSSRAGGSRPGAAVSGSSAGGAVRRLLPGAVRRLVRLVRDGVAERALGKAFWGRVSGRRDVLAVIEKADVVVALDSGAVWAGWNVGQRWASVPVVLGIPAARRELEQLKASVGHG
ncbi:hypothetical protein [Kribbella sp. NPDC055071]